jgi:uncharacterized damage-inducible protein DinB
MNDGLAEIYRHNAWATRRLLEFCAQFPVSVLDARTSGTYGTLVETFDHLISSDGGYLRSLSGAAPAWIEEEETHDLGELQRRADEVAGLWEAFWSQPVDVDRRLLLDQGTYECSAAIVIAQAPHHGSVHREQIGSILTTLGYEPPDLQPWGFADETGRARRIEK